MNILQRWRGKEYHSLSHYLQDRDTWDVRCERKWGTQQVFTAIAADPVLDVLVVGNELGNIEVFGARALSTSWTLPDGGKPRFIGISSTECCVLCLDTLEKLHVYDLNSPSGSPPISTVLVPKGVNFLSIPSGHNHLFLPYPDGSVHTYDVSRLRESPYMIPPRTNSTATEKEEKLPFLVMDIAQHPIDPNLLFLAYEDNLILWDIGEHRSLLELFPITDPPTTITTIVVHPNGQTLVSGHIDGTMMMWSIGETCKVFWKGNLKQLYAPSIEQAQEGAGAGTENIEPIFKLLWAGSHSDVTQLFVLGGGTSSQPRLSSITFPSVPRTSENLDPKGLRFQFYPQIDSTPIRDFVLIPPSRPENILTLQNEVFLSTISPQSTQANIPFSLLPPITHSHLLTIDRGGHCKLSAFISEAEALLPSLSLGGVLHQERSAETADPRLVKYQRRQLILTHHLDHQLRFHDISPHLLSSSPSLNTAYPAPLAKLTIDVRAPLEDSFIWSTLAVPPEEMCVQRVMVAHRAGECGVVFKSGEVVLWALRAEDEREEDKNNLEMDIPTGEEMLLDLRMVESDGGAWRPKMLFNPKEGVCTAIALCDVGFLALGYERSLYVIDLRGPKIILRHPCTKRRSDSLDSFTVLNWSICGLNESTSPSLHLFAGATSGTIQVLSLVHGQGGWSVDPNILTLSPIDNLTNLTTLIVVDATTGEELTPSPERLLAAMKGSKSSGLYWIIATSTEVRCMDGINTKRIGNASFPVGVGVGAKEIGVVRHADSTALMSFISDGSVIGYSIPSLQPLLHYPKENGSSPSELLLPNPSSVSLSSTGHALVLSQPQRELTLWRLFYAKRTPLPVLRFSPPIKERQSQETGVLMWISLLSGSGAGKVVSREAVDEILAGPNRPPTRIRLYEGASEVGREEGGIYERMIYAAQERGERLAGINERTEQLEDASHSFAAQAARLAQQQRKANWFGF